MNTEDGRELRSLLELLAIWSCHIWLVNFASLTANLSLGQGLLVDPILLFFIPPSRRSPGMTGIHVLLTGMLNLNSTHQSK